MSAVLHFSLGPVQSFIDEARRTRDWWAGSFLLAWLSGQAMRAVVDGGYGRVTTPVLDDDLMWQALRDPGSTWAVGTLPNRFRAVIDDPQRFAKDDPCRVAVEAHWGRLAQEVWDFFVEPAFGSPLDEQRAKTEQIWKRQVAGFWEINWVLGHTSDPTEASDASWLDQRKNWRTHRRAPEPGDHCRLMGEWQELSGWVRSLPAQRARQDAFWSTIQAAIVQGVNHGPAKADSARAEFELLELDDTERLCAVALVKRLFPVLPKATVRAAIGWNPGRGEVRRWPSTANLAALPWLQYAWEIDSEACAEFITAAQNAGVTITDDSTDPQQSFFNIDGRLLYRSSLETEIARAEGDLRTAKDANERVRADRLKKAYQATRRALDRLQKTIHQGGAQSFRVKKFAEAKPHFAVLVMDGDEAGRLITAFGGTRVSQALQRFGWSVAKPGGIVASHRGRLVFAGGDDVQALLPLDSAFACVRAIHAAYLSAFDEVLGAELDDLRGLPATISAALVIADFKEPLSAVIREGHTLLERTAKGANGRNSLAVSVLKASGARTEFVTSFGRERHDGPIQGAGPLHVDRLAAAYANQPSEWTSSFLYRLRQRYGALLEGEENEVLFVGEQRASVILAQWSKGRNLDATQHRRALHLVEELIAACTVMTRSQLRSFTLEPALMARFLADRGVHAVVQEAVGE